MKKLVLAVAIFTGFASVLALPTNVLPVVSTNIEINEEFIEIPLEKLPDAIVSNVKKDFPSASISKAYVNDKYQYKLEIVDVDETKTIYADEDGNWLDESEVDGA